MMTETSTPVSAGAAEVPRAIRAGGGGKARPPAEFVQDSGQILLELLRDRAVEDRRRFVAGLRRRGGAKPAAAE